MSDAKNLFLSPGRLITHTRYVLQDYLMLRAALPVLIITLITWTVIHTTLKSATAKQLADPRFFSYTHSQYAGFSGVLLYFGVMLAVIAVMTIDRTTGYYRFFFSKPVNVVSYYLHTFAVSGAALCVILALFALAWSTWLPHESIHRATYAGLIAFALIGGLGFGFGALTNTDAALTPLSFIFAISAQATLVGYTGPPKWLVFVAKVLPPANAFETTRSQLMNSHPFLGAPLWHVLAYGAGGWILGRIFLRWRQLAR